MSADASPTWRAVRGDVAASLAAAHVASADAEARFLVEAVSGHDPSEWPAVAGEQPSARAVARLEAMVDRRVGGEPLQYVLGEWAFRGLDLMVDRRVLIPRPETEHVVEVALEEAVRLGLRRVRSARRALVETEPAGVIVDLGTGSGAIALAIEAELPDVVVWATDVSADALAVARANVAGCAATRVRVASGSWFDALPTELHGRVTMVVSNPPYIAAHEVADLPAEVAGYEPRDALVAGPTGCEALDHLLANASDWLVPGGALVCEIAPHQAADLTGRARDRGYSAVDVRDDLAGRARVLVARTG